MTYKISKVAKNDIEEIWFYTFKNWSLEQAERYYDLIMDEIEYISINPNSGKDFGKIRKGYKRARIKSHFIFYRIDHLQNEIEIIRVLHQSMDIENKLNE